MEFNYSAPPETESSSSEEEEEDSQLPFWNNWLPLTDRVCFNQYNENDVPNQEKVTRKFICNSLAFSSINLFAKNAKHGNWLPPVKFVNIGVKSKSKPIQEKNGQHKALKKSINTETVRVPYMEGHESNVKMKETPWQGNIICRRDGTFDWGGRMQLYNITKFNDGDLIWGIVNLGVFAHIKLWINDYGNICASADGTISKLGSTEATFISITDAELLRKMLCLSGAQWVSLCETVQEAQSTLKFDAFQEFKLIGKTSLEKLWFFICKRRHFLPDQCMLVKLNGAVKCMRKFKIAPKVIVQEIRNISGQSVL